MKFTILFSMWIATASSGLYWSSQKDQLYYSVIDLKHDVPIDASSTIKKLYLSEASGSIGIKTFSSMPELEHLELRWCQITTIEDGALCSSTHLQTILIFECVEFPILTKSLFNNCANLNKLYLHGLKLTPFSGEFLEPMRNLNELLLHHCELGEINSNALCTSPKLETLSIEKNSISSPLTKSLFENCNTVITFRFLCNGIVNIDKEAFAGFVNLKTAMFNSLNIIHLTKGHLSGLNNLEVLHIKNSSVSSISNDAFEDLVKLEELYVIFNHLRIFNSALLSSCPSVSSLSLVGNNLTTIDNFKHPNIQFLDVSLNSIEEIDIDTVKVNLPGLVLLDAPWNKMSRKYEESLKEQFPHFNMRVLDKGSLYIRNGCDLECSLSVYG